MIDRSAFQVAVRFIRFAARFTQHSLMTAWNVEMSARPSKMTSGCYGVARSAWCRPRLVRRTATRLTRERNTFFGLMVPSSAATTEVVIRPGEQSRYSEPDVA